MAGRAPNVRFKAHYHVDGRSYQVTALRWSQGRISSVEFDLGEGRPVFVSADLVDLVMDQSNQPLKSDRDDNGGKRRVADPVSVRQVEPGREAPNEAPAQEVPEAAPASRRPRHRGKAKPKGGE